LVVRQQTDGVAARVTHDVLGNDEPIRVLEHDRAIRIGAETEITQDIANTDDGGSAMGPIVSTAADTPVGLAAALPA
jgi:hypothetical protein